MGEGGVMEAIAITGLVCGLFSVAVLAWVVSRLHDLEDRVEFTTDKQLEAVARIQWEDGQWKAAETTLQMMSTPKDIRTMGWAS